MGSPLGLGNEAFVGQWEACGSETQDSLECPCHLGLQDTQMPLLPCVSNSQAYEGRHCYVSPFDLGPGGMSLALLKFFCFVCPCP